LLLQEPARGVVVVDRELCPGNAVVVRPHIKQRERRRQVAQLACKHNRYLAQLATSLAIGGVTGQQLARDRRREANLRRRHQQKRCEPGDAARLTLIGVSSHPDTPAVTTPPKPPTNSLDHPDLCACQARSAAQKALRTGPRS